MTRQNKVNLDVLQKEFDKALTDFRLVKTKKEVNDFVNNLKVNESQPYNVITLNNANQGFIFNLPRTLLDKYQNNGFVILNLTNKLSYIVCKHTNAKVRKCNEVINELNKLTGGRGGGKDNYCQGSTPDTNCQDKIIEFIKKIK
ncbi:MAG: DHHA1 domain-containing protein [Mycoplasmoidaceae bacterium]|nr:DHHA1 domain-containing protein [Mycoplasmoidaceae bacterium]